MMETVGALVGWYLVAELLGLLAWPWTYHALSRLPDRGYAVSKIIGILTLGLISWWGVSYQLVSSSSGTLWGMLLLAAVALALAHQTPRGRRQIRSAFGWLRMNRALAAVTELIFLMTVLSWTVVRSFDAAIQHTEQPMDLTLVSGIWASPGFPPQDPWLAGFPIAYYYFGYWLLVTLGRLLLTPPEVTYNLGQAIWYGLMALGCFGLGYNLGSSHLEKGRLSKPGVLTGVLSVIWVGLCGNLLAVLEWLFAKGLLSAESARWWNVKGFPDSSQVTGEWATVTHWWWRSSRVVQDQGPLGEQIEIITEFPFFSFFLGDNHPHLLSIPIVLLFLVSLLNVFLASLQEQQPDSATAPRWYPDRVRRVLVLFLPAAVFMGAVGLINPWNLPACFLLVLSVFWIAQLGEAVNARSLRTLTLFTALMVLGQVLLYWPVLLSAQGAVYGLLINFHNPTQLRQVILMFGSFIPATLALLLLRRRFAIVVPKVLVVVGGVAVATPVCALMLAVGLLLSAPSRDLAYERWLSSVLTAVLLGILVGLSIALLVASQKGPKGSGNDLSDGSARFSLLLVGMGWLLILIPEFVFIHDVFATRMNTVFKFYFLAWIFLGTGGAYAVVKGLLASGRITRVMASLSLLLVSTGLLYPAAVLSGLKAGEVSPSLDGLRYLSERAPDEWAAIEWIRQNTPGNSTVLEEAGESYHPEFNRFSTATGRPTLLGWPGHELQWRGNAYGEMTKGRLETLELVYAKGSVEQVAKTVEDWGIDYVVVGPVERGRHQIGSEREQILGRALEEVFRSGPVTLYKKRVW